MFEHFLENYIDFYIDYLYKNQNETIYAEQKGLFTKKDYYECLKPVIDMIKNHKEYTIEEIRAHLYEKSGLERKVSDFIYKKEMAPGIVMRYGTPTYCETIVAGNKKEVAMDKEGKIVPMVEKMKEDTIFDLASITKIFTSLSILKLEQMGLLCLSDEVTKYDDRFTYLKGITIFDLITFQIPLKTKKRVDEAKTRREAEEILFSIEIDQLKELKRPYTDMGAMVLKYVIEKASGMEYYDFLKKMIFSPLHMEDTYVTVPKEKLNRLASTNYGIKYGKENYSITINKEGAVYDPKAQVMGQMEGKLSGHAGLFSTAQDMTTFAKTLIEGTFLPQEQVENFARNKIGRMYIEGQTIKYVQYYGMLCYSKHPKLENTEVYHALSGKAFASVGWTGTYLTVDPMNQLYLFLGSNRSHNRFTFIDPTKQEEISVDKNGRRTIILPNKEIKTDASRFTFDRNKDFVYSALKLILQYKMVEDLYEVFFEKGEKKEKTYTL